MVSMTGHGPDFTLPGPGLPATPVNWGERDGFPQANWPKADIRCDGSQPAEGSPPGRCRAPPPVWRFDGQP